jgi:transposase
MTFTRETLIQKIPKPESTTEFQEPAVKRVKDGKTVGAVAKEMGLVEPTLRHWVKASAAGQRAGPGAMPAKPNTRINRCMRLRFTR